MDLNDLISCQAVEDVVAVEDAVVAEHVAVEAVAVAEDVAAAVVAEDAVAAEAAADGASCTIARPFRLPRLGSGLFHTTSTSRENGSTYAGGTDWQKMEYHMGCLEWQ